jgi:hypothetical protein
MTRSDTISNTKRLASIGELGLFMLDLGVSESWQIVDLDFLSLGMKPY